MTSVHGGDCNGTWCSYCGCCEHGESRDGIGCRASDAPDGMRCTNAYCGCEGAMGYDKPTQPPEATAEPEDDRPRQLHQETSLFDSNYGTIDLDEHDEQHDLGVCGKPDFA